MKKLGMAVVGCGRISICHLNVIRELSNKMELIAVVDQDEKRASEAAKKFSAKKYYLGYEDAFADPEINAVIIGLPHHLHFPAAIAAVRANKHILVEKPFARSYEEAKQIVDEGKKHSVVVMVGQSRRYYDALFKAREILPQIGRPLNINYLWGDCFNPKWTPPWWQSAVKTDGLVIPLCGSHALDYVLWTLNEMPIRVYAEVAKSPDLPWEGEDQVNIVLSFKDGSMASVCMSGTCCPEVHEVTIIGPKGVIKYKGGEEHLTEFVGFCEIDLYFKGEKIMSGLQSRSNFSLQMEEFTRAINENRKPMASGEEILVQMQVLAAIQESARSHRAISLNI